MAEQVTMKQIAERVGVSVNTVHKALTGKPGVSDAVRRRIAETASQMGYHRNARASALSRSKIRIVAAIPSPEGEGHYYYSYLWQGIRRRFEDDADVIIQDLRPYPNGCYEKMLSQLLEEAEGGLSVDGLLAYAPTGAAAQKTLSALGARHIPIEILDGAQEVEGRLGCLVSDYAAAGKLMAEQALHLLPEGTGRVLVLAGSPETASHREVFDSFREAFHAAAPAHEIVCVQGAHGEAGHIAQEAERCLRSDMPPVLALSVFAVGTEILCQCLERTGLAGRIPAIGNDLFPESVHALKTGVLSNIIYKAPSKLAWSAADVLVNHLLWSTDPDEKVLRGEVEMVFRSNLAQYCTRMGIPCE